MAEPSYRRRWRAGLEASLRCESTEASVEVQAVEMYPLSLIESRCGVECLLRTALVRSVRLGPERIGCARMYWSRDVHVPIVQ